MTVSSTSALFDHLVLDSAPLLQNNFPETLSKAFYTCPGVISELKDEATRQRIKQLPYHLEVKQPSEEALALATRWARATGDISTLSHVDLQVLALVVTLELEINKDTSKLLLDPSKRPECRVWNGAEGYFSRAGKKTGTSDSKNRRRGGVEVDSFDDAPKQLEEVTKRLNAAKVTHEDDSSDGEWITPENLDKYKQKHAGKSSTKEWTVTGLVKSTSVNPVSASALPARIACISSDFAVQNVLLQMRCELYSPDGCRIERLKNWLLRCHACYHCTFDLDTGFCAKCGSPALTRTSYMLDDKGQVHLFLKKDFVYRLRGTKYSIPKPSAGKKSEREVLLLRADQKEYERARVHYERIQGKLERQMLQLGEPGSLEDKLWAMEDAKDTVTRSANRRDHYDGLSLPTIGFGRRNPNAYNRKRV